jgi:hypothetical protein
VGSALAYAHQQGILHRDIKPSNVLLGTDGHIWLADFGLARIAQAAESTLSSDMIMGTPQYISPEQAMGDKKLDEGTDIYSFGVMLFEMVVGQVPFNADTPFSIIHDHIYRPLPMPRAINPKVPEPVERVLLKALAKDRADRFPDVNSLIQAFKDAWREAGVPMQGTAITMRPGALKTAARTMPAATPTAATLAPVAGAATTPADPARKAAPWLLIGGGVALLACLGVGAVVGLRLLGQRPFSVARPTGISASTPVSGTAVAVQSHASDTPAGVVTETSAPAVATALDAAGRSPNDPQRALALSLAYWDAGQARISLVSLAKAADLAGHDNTAFFQSAAGQFRQRQAWIAATAMYVRAVKSLGPGVPPPDELRNNFHEALYKASGQADVPAYLSFDDLALVEQPITLVAHARYLYYNGDTQQAHSLLNEVRTLKPHMAEASLLEAEMDANEGKTFEAKQILNILLADLATPDWLREMAQSLSNKIP